MNIMFCRTGVVDGNSEGEGCNCIGNREDGVDGETTSDREWKRSHCRQQKENDVSI